MGTMVWTAPRAVRFEINRVGVFTANRNHRAPWKDDYGELEINAGLPAPGPPTDTCGACDQIAIDVGGTPFAGGDGFQQRLSVYGAESTIAGDGVRARCFVSAVSDVLVVEIDDQRPHATRPLDPIRITLSLWGEPVERSLGHVSSCKFTRSDDTRSVARTFVEADYYCQSALSVRSPNRVLKLESATDTEQTYVLAGGQPGKTRILIASAATMDRRSDLLRCAAGILASAASKSNEQLRRPHREWSSGFWSRKFVNCSRWSGNTSVYRPRRPRSEGLPPGMDRPPSRP